MPNIALTWNDLKAEQRAKLCAGAEAYVTQGGAGAEEIASEIFYLVVETLSQREGALLRPIDTLSEMIGLNALSRMKRLRDQADYLEKHGDGSIATVTRMGDRREHADLIEEIHRQGS